MRSSFSAAAVSEWIRSFAWCSTERVSPPIVVEIKLTLVAQVADPYLTVQVSHKSPILSEARLAARLLITEPPIVGHQCGAELPVDPVERPVEQLHVLPAVAVLIDQLRHLGRERVRIAAFVVPDTDQITGGCVERFRSTPSGRS
jgi:hypothetical protein